MTRSCVKWLIVSTVALALSLGLGVPALAASWNDLDVPTLDSYGISTDQIAQLSDGFPDGRWEPWRLVTRAQFAKMADRAFDIQPVASATPSFSDVAADDPLYGYVEGAHADGLMNGVAEGVFAPAAPITREQAIAVVARQAAAEQAFDLSGMTEDEIASALAGFNDADSVSAGLRAEMAFAVQQGIVRGSKAGALLPQASLTRIAAAALLIRAAAYQAPTLYEKDSGTHLSLETGDTFQVVLKGNPTTGYTWVPVLSDADAAILQQLGDAGFVADSDLIGAGGTFTFTFKATAAGEADLELDYMRPWESVPPLQTFTVSVTVTAPPLDGTKWRLEGWSFDSLDPADFEITASFQDGQIGGKAAVNLYSGPYHAGLGDQLSIGRLIRTLIAGSDPEMRAEGAYFDLLSQVRQYKLDDAHLTLMDAKGNELLIFDPAT